MGNRMIDQEPRLLEAARAAFEQNGIAMVLTFALTLLRMQYDGTAGTAGWVRTVIESTLGRK